MSNTGKKKLRDLILFFTNSKKIIAMSDIAFLWILLAMGFYSMGLMAVTMKKIGTELFDWYSIIFIFIFSFICFYFYKYSLRK